MSTLIYEANYTGHRPEYVAHLMQYIIARPYLHGKYTFLLIKNIRNRIGILSKSEAFAVEYFENNKKSARKIVNKYHEWNFISKIITGQKGYSEIIFLDIDQYLIFLTLSGFRKRRILIKGILFQPYIHFTNTNDSFLFFIKKVVKNYILQTCAVYTNTNLNKLFILNDKEGARQMNKKLKNVFQFLPDPITNASININQNLLRATFNKYNIQLNKKNLLLFGSIDARKNLINIIDALLLLPTELKSAVHLIIAGNFDSAVRKRYIDYINLYKDKISIAYNDAFVSDQEMEVLFQNCDLVVMAYINFYSSSGILGHAIKHNKKVIASNTGLVSKMVKEYDLGKTVNPLDINEIRDAMRQLLTASTTEHYNGLRLIEEYSPSNFSKTILS